MNARTNKENQTVHAQGTLETKVVDTVDYQSSAGQGQERRPVHVTHQLHPSENSTTTSGGVLAGAAAAVSSALQSARDAISQK